jgi:hypothetical protein
MVTIKKKIVGIILIVSVISLLLKIYVITPQLNYNEIQKYSRFTIGITTDVSIAVKGNDYINYIYYVNGTKYKGDTYLKYSIKVPNGRYYVKFSSKNPWKSILMSNEDVPDSIKLAPSGGWDKIPHIYDNIGP